MSQASSYSHSFHLPAERGAVFALFSDPRQLDRLTPSWFRLRPIGEVPESLAAGVEIEYRLRWRGLPLRWTSRMTDWREPEFFAYEQKRGPYLFFRHEHYFEPAEGGTAIRDRVVFRAPGGRLAARCIALPDLRRIFAFRERQALALLRPLEAGSASGRDASSPAPRRASG